MTSSRFINAILVVVLWPAVLVLYQLCMTSLYQLRSPKEQFWQLVWISLGLLALFAEYEQYSQKEYLILSLIHVVSGIYSYGMVEFADAYIARRQAKKRARGICFMCGS